MRPYRYIDLTLQLLALAQSVQSADVQLKTRYFVLEKLSNRIPLTLSQVTIYGPEQGKKEKSKARKGEETGKENERALSGNSPATTSQQAATDHMDISRDDHMSPVHE